jgi:hypothetical protein
MAIIENKQNSTILSGHIEFQKKNSMTNVSIETISSASVLSGEWRELSSDESNESIKEILATNRVEKYHGTITSEIEEQVLLEAPISQYTIFCPKMSIEFAKKYLIQLKKLRKGNSVPFFSEDEYDLFIQKACMGDKRIKKFLFNSKAGTKKDFIAIFHAFYVAARDNKLSERNSTSIFKSLIVDNFEGWTYKELIGNFKS